MMFETRLKTTLTLLFLVLVLTTSFLIGPMKSAAASSSPDFMISANPTSQTIHRGGTAVYNIHIGAVNGFMGTVTLTDIDPYSKTVPSFSSTTVTGSGDVQFKVFSNGHQTPLGTATLTVTGTSGNLRHAIEVTLTVAPSSATAPGVSASSSSDFTVTVDPLSQTRKRGTGAPYFVTITAVNGFHGTAMLSLTGDIPPNGVVSIDQPGIGPLHDGEVSIEILKHTVITGTFAMTIHAISGSLEHDVTISLTII